MLKLKGKPLVLRPTPAKLLAIKAALDKSPADEVFEGSDVAKMANVGLTTLKRMLTEYPDELIPYTAIVPHGPYTVRYWGNQKAIEELGRMAGL